MAIPTFTKGKLALVAQDKEGQPLTSKVEALDDPRHGTPDQLPPSGTVDKSSVDTMAEKRCWEAIMDDLRTLQVKTKGEQPMIPVDERASEARAIVGFERSSRGQ